MFRTLRQSSAILRYAQRAHLTTSTRQIRGIQPSLIQAADQDFLHIANIPSNVKKNTLYYHWLIPNNSFIHRKSIHCSPCCFLDGQDT